MDSGALVATHGAVVSDEPLASHVGRDVMSEGGNAEMILKEMQRAFADRNVLLGDPNFVSIPQDSLLSVAYAIRRRADIDPSHATPSHNVAPGIVTARHE